MPLSEDIALGVIGSNADAIRNLKPEEQERVVTELRERLSIYDELEGQVEPELQQKIQELKAQADHVRKVGESAFVQFSPMRAMASDLSNFIARTTGWGAASRLEKAMRAAELQKQGVITGEELPVSDIALGFGTDLEKDVKGLLDEHFKTNIQVFSSGEDLLYIDPTVEGPIDAIKRVEPDLISNLGYGLTATGDIAGTIGAGFLARRTKHPATIVAAETLGSTAGTATMEYLRLLTGKSMGVHDLSQDEMLEQSGIKGLKAGAATAAMGGAIAVYKGSKNVWDSNVFTKEAAIEHGLSTKQADVFIDEVNKILGRKGVTGTLFTRAGGQDVRMGSMQAEVKKSAEHAQQFFERDLADQNALVEALNIVTKPSKARGGIAVSDVLTKQIGARTAKAKEIVAGNVEQLKIQLQSISKISKETVGEPTRGLILKKRDAFDRLVKSTWGKVEKLGGYNAEKELYDIPIAIGKNTKLRQEIMVRRAKSAISSTTEKSAKKIFAAGKKKPIADLADYNANLSDIRRDLRALYSNKQFGDPSTRALEAVKQSMIQDRRLELIKAGKGDLLKQIETAEAKTAQFYKIFDNSIIGDLTEKTTTGTFKIKSMKFVDSILKGNKEDAEQLLAVIGSKPTLVNQWKEGLGDAFKRDIIDKFKVERGTKLHPSVRKEMIEKSKAWIKQHEPVLSKFFTDTELKSIQKTANFAVLVKKQIAQEERIIKNAATKWGRGKLTSLDPDDLVNFVTNKTGSFTKPSGNQGVQVPLNKIRYVKNITKNHPGAWQKFKEEFSTSLRKSAVDPETGHIKPATISEWVNEQGDEIAEIMGPVYLKNLRSINKVAQILKAKPKLLAAPELQRTAIQLIRGTMAPPLTPKGRLFTAALMFREKQTHKRIADALLDPATMKQVAELAEHKRFTREAAELAVSLGFITFDEKI